MLPQQAVRSAKRVPSYQRLPKKSSGVSPRCSISSQTSGAQRVGAETSQKQVEASSYWSRAYANLALTSGNLWNGFKNMFSRSSVKLSPAIKPADIKGITAPDLSAFPALKSASSQKMQPTETLLPLVTEEQAIAQVAQDALNDIEEAHKNIHIPQAEKGLMVCTPPGINSALLLEFDSIEAIQNYFKKRWHDIDLNYKDIEAMSDEVFSEYLAKREHEHKYLSTVYYKQPQKGVKHDEKLPKFVIEQTKRLLLLAGINPLSVSIIAEELKNTRGAIGTAGGPSIIIKEDGTYALYQPAVISYDWAYCWQTNHKELMHLIAHEVGHIVAFHNYQFHLWQETWIVTESTEEERFREKQWKNIFHDTGMLKELEADVLLALNNKEIADIVHGTLKERLSKPHSSASNSTSKKISSLHPTINDRYLWIQRINELHKKEKKRHDL